MPLKMKNGVRKIALFSFSKAGQGKNSNLHFSDGHFVALIRAGHCWCFQLVWGDFFKRKCLLFCDYRYLCRFQKRSCPSEDSSPKQVQKNPIPFLSSQNTDTTFVKAKKLLLSHDIWLDALSLILSAILNCDSFVQLQDQQTEPVGEDLLTQTEALSAINKKTLMLS